MLKFRLWCFINKLRMVKANARYKKFEKSGTKIEWIVISESFPEIEWEDGKLVYKDCQ